MTVSKFPMVLAGVFAAALIPSGAFSDALIEGEEPQPTVCPEILVTPTVVEGVVDVAVDAPAEDGGDESTASIDDSVDGEAGGEFPLGMNPEIVQFSATGGSGGTEVQRDGVEETDLTDEAFQSGAAPAVLVAAVPSSSFDPTMGINPSDKVAVAAQCDNLATGKKTYEAFYKLYCN